MPFLHHTVLHLFFSEEHFADGVRFSNLEFIVIVAVLGWRYHHLTLAYRGLITELLCSSIKLAMVSGGERGRDTSLNDLASHALLAAIVLVNELSLLLVVHNVLHLFLIHEIRVWVVLIAIKEELFPLSFLFLLILHAELPVALLYHLTDLVNFRFKGALFVLLVQYLALFSGVGHLDEAMLVVHEVVRQRVHLAHQVVNLPYPIDLLPHLSHRCGLLGRIAELRLLLLSLQRFDVIDEFICLS